MNRKEYEGNPKKCFHCKKKLPYEKRRSKFCNSSCSASHNNKGVRRHGGWSGNCLNCQKSLTGRRKDYCNKECLSEKRHRDWIGSWLNGDESGVCGGKYQATSKHVYRWLRETQGLKCSICGIEEWNGKPVPLVLDHIDGDALNTSPENVRFVCRNCDGQLPTFCGKNKGNGKRKFTISYVN